MEEEKIILLETSYEDYGKFTIVYNPTWDGPIEKYEESKDWKVIYLDKIKKKDDRI